MSGEPSDQEPSLRDAPITPEQGTLEQLASEDGFALLGMAASARPKLGAVARMGLALSGGGYRAAAFHLGVMGVLHRVGLLPTVRVLEGATAFPDAGFHAVGTPVTASIAAIRGLPIPPTFKNSPPAYIVEPFNASENTKLSADGFHGSKAPAPLASTAPRKKRLVPAI